LEPITATEPTSNTDIKIFGRTKAGREVRYVPRDYKFPKRPKTLSKWKIFVPCAWGNMSEANGLGGAYSDIFVAEPWEACTKTYTTSGCFEDKIMAQKHAKYLLTKFCRSLLYINKNGMQATRDTFAAIPIQDYSEPWWDESIAQIDEHLFDKYNVPDNIRTFVRNNIQTRSEDNIINL